MKTLMIKDLAVTEQLDRKAMAAVQGGMLKGGSPYVLPMLGSSKHDFSFDATQLIGQTQNIVNQNGNNVAFSNDIHSTIKPTQTASNNLSF